MRSLRRMIVWIACRLMVRTWRPGKVVLSRLVAEGKHNEAWSRLKNMLMMAIMRKATSKRRGRIVAGIIRAMAKKYMAKKR